MTEPLVEQARGGGAPAIKARIKQIYQEMGSLEGLNELYQRTLKQVD